MFIGGGSFNGFIGKAFKNAPSKSSQNQIGFSGEQKQNTFVNSQAQNNASKEKNPKVPPGFKIIIRHARKLDDSYPDRKVYYTGNTKVITIFDKLYA